VSSGEEQKLRNLEVRVLRKIFEAKNLGSKKI
jgi:hypothetical protein